MNSFLKEIAALTELPFDTAFSAYRYVNIGGAALYVQGHKGVISYGTDKIALRIKNGRLEVAGHDLAVKQLSADEIVMTGRIVSLTAEESFPAKSSEKKDGKTAGDAGAGKNAEKRV